MPPEAGCRKRPSAALGLPARRRLPRIPAPVALGLPARRKWAILLALALLFTQYVLIAHQIGHQPDASEASCELCLVAPHQGSTPISKDNPPAIVHGQDASAFSAIAGRVILQITTGFSARAPPSFPRA